MSKQGWENVSRTKRCVICGHPDWCSYSTDGKWACCKREKQNGFIKETKGGGYLHLLHDEDKPKTYRRQIVIEVEKADLGELAKQYQSAVDSFKLRWFAYNLGLNCEDLKRFGTGWAESYHAWSFPMVDAGGTVRGIRLRSAKSGKKFAVRGGHEGLFIPVGNDWGHGCFYIVEGPTDAAALAGLGFPLVVGRPNCLGGSGPIIQLAKKHLPEKAVIFADNDGPGIDGANRLAVQLQGYVPGVKVVIPPPGVKDIRAWAKTGAVKSQVDELIEMTPPKKLATVIRKGASYAK